MSMTTPCYIPKNDDADQVCIFINEAADLNSLTAIGAHERQRFNELRGTVVSRQFFIRSQSLIAR